MPLRIIPDPGPGGGSSVGVALPSSGLVVDGPFELMLSDGLVYSVVPEQRRITIGPGYSGQVIGDMPYFDGTNWVRLPAGSAGQVLRSAGAAAPAWAFEPARCYANAQQDFSGTSFSDVTALTFPVLANANYAFRFAILCQSTDTTEAMNFSVNGPASPTAINYGLIIPISSAGSINIVVKSAYDTSAAQTVGPGATPKLATLEGVLENGANAGTLALRAATETGSGGRVTSVLRGSYGLMWRIS